MIATTLATILILASFHSISTYKLPFDGSDVGLNTFQMIENHGYPCENHYITTEDGYILTYQRIPHGQNDDGSGQKPAILLMHGLSSSSADYVDMGPDRSLAYILADIGYDVWLGNARGNAWSRNHTTLDVVTDAEQFFDFSWHEIGYYDLPAAVDHILSVNRGDSLYYVGHSQGCTSFLVFASTRPEYNSKIKLASLMGPAAFMEHQTDSLLVVLSKYIFDIERLFLKYKIYELPNPKALQAAAAAICTIPENYNICVLTLGLIDGVDSAELLQSDFALITSNAPSNFAMKQVLHYGQLIKNGGFRQYDHGADNLAIYGTDTPPDYDLAKITAPVAVYYGLNDGLVNYKDAQTVVNSVSNLAADYLVSYELFNHIDFIFAADIVDLLYIDLIKLIQSY